MYIISEGLCNFVNTLELCLLNISRKIPLVEHLNLGVSHHHIAYAAISRPLQYTYFNFIIIQSKV